MAFTCGLVAFPTGFSPFLNGARGSSCPRSLIHSGRDTDTAYVSPSAEGIEDDTEMVEQHSAFKRRESCLCDNTASQLTLLSARHRPAVWTDPSPFACPLLKGAEWLPGSATTSTAARLACLRAGLGACSACGGVPGARLQAPGRAWLL